MARILSKLSRIAKAEYPISRILLRSVVYSIDTTEKAIALTFDDGPTEHTEELLEVLETNGARGTFFDVGCKLEQYKGLIKSMHERGHELANHTRFNKLSVSEMLGELKKTNSALQEITGVRPCFMRPPGKVSTDFRNVLMYFCAGLKVVYDTLAPPDFMKDCPMELIRDGLLDVAKPGTIVCLHDMHPHTRQALAEALPVLRERGFSFPTLSEMARTGKLSPYRNLMVPVQYREYSRPHPGDA